LHDRRRADYDVRHRHGCGDADEEDGRARDAGHNTMSTRAVPSSKGVIVALHDLGGAGSPLVICHATGFHGRMYAPLAASLAERYHTYAIDFRGHGASNEPDDGDFAWQGMADDLLACIGAIGADRVLAVGHSMGGAAILLTEQRCPGVIAGSFLFEPIVFSEELVSKRGENPMAGPARRRREVFPSRDEVLWRYASRPPLNVMRADALALYVQHGFVDLPNRTVRLACRAESEARTFEADDKLTLDLVGEMTVPTVVGAGLADPGPGPGPAMMAGPLADALPNGRLVEYPFLGHFGPFQDPDRIAADILAAFG
jgi:pimeloyl-ACP methyl ester carboxylesterase